MKKVLLCLLLVLLFIPLLGMRAGPGEGITRCLLIGCDRFVSMPGTEPASANNVETMGALLSDFLPKGSVIRRTVNGPGTVEGFERLMTEVFRETDEADTSILYLSTHGLLKEVNEQQRMALLLSDGTEEEYLKPGMLRSMLERIPGKKLLILDACHSGAVIGCGGAGINWFDDESCRVLVSSGALEDSWFWSTGTDEYTGTGYFTSSMDSALRASDPEQIDPDGSGNVSLKELTARLREIHGASTVYCWPEESDESLFRLPADRKAGNRLQGVSFGECSTDGKTVTLPIHFRITEQVRVMYQLIPSVNGTWDFEHTVREPDRAKTGLIRGLMSPGEWNREIKLKVKSMGPDKRMLMQIVSLRGDGQTPVTEAGRVIDLNDV